MSPPSSPKFEIRLLLILLPFRNGSREEQYLVAYCRWFRKAIVGLADFQVAQVEGADRQEDEIGGNIPELAFEGLLWARVKPIRPSSPKVGAEAPTSAAQIPGVVVLPSPADLGAVFCEGSLAE